MHVWIWKLIGLHGLRYKVMFTHVWQCMWHVCKTGYILAYNVHQNVCVHVHLWVFYIIQTCASEYVANMFLAVHV